MNAETKALVALLRDRHHTTQEDGLAALQNTVTKATNLIERLTAENARLREALEPFARVAELDIGTDEEGEDVFWPISNARYSMAGRLRVKHLRHARAALAGEAGYD